MYLDDGVKIYTKGEISMETTQKIGLALISVDLIAVIAIVIMYPLVLLPISVIIGNALKD